MTTHWQIESFKKTENRTLSRTRSTDQCDHLASINLQAEVFKDGGILTRRIDVLHAFELEVPDEFLWLVTLVRLRVDGGLALDGIEDLVCGSYSLTECLHMGEIVADGNSSYHSRHHNRQNIRHTQLSRV